MVDSIKSQPSSTASQQIPRNNGNTLRDNFKSISSGLSVSQVMRDAPAVVHVNAGARSQVPVGKIIDNLRDAVKSSRQTLKALEDVAAAAEEEDATAVKAFADDLDGLKSDIVDLLHQLRERASRAEVLNENIQAADSRLEDVDKANYQARSTGSEIHFNSEEALNAHSLNTETVSKLLGE